MMSKLRPGYDPDDVPAFPKAGRRSGRRTIAGAALTLLARATSLLRRRSRNAPPKPGTAATPQPSAVRKSPKLITVMLPKGYDLERPAATLTEMNGRQWTHGPDWDLTTINAE